MNARPRSEPRVRDASVLSLMYLSQASLEDLLIIQFDTQISMATAKRAAKPSRSSWFAPASEET